MSNGKHVFLSYSRKDTKALEAVKDTLEQSGIAIWTDERIKSGTPVWQFAIDEAIENSFMVIVLLSPDAKESVWVQREITRAEQLHKPIIPLLLRGEPFEAQPLSLVSAQFIDLRSKWGEGMEDLLKTIKDYWYLLQNDLYTLQKSYKHENDYAGKVWFRVTPHSEDVGVLFKVTAQWGPYEYQKFVYGKKEGVTFVHRKAVDEVTPPLNITTSKPCIIEFGEGEPLADEVIDTDDTIDNNQGWYRYL